VKGRFQQVAHLLGQRRAASLGQRDLRDGRRLAVLDGLLWLQQVAGLDLDKTPAALDVADQRFRPGPILAVGHHGAVRPNAARRHVNVVAVADDGEALEAHAAGPVLSDGRHLDVAQRPLFGREAQRHVRHVDAQAWPQGVQPAELGRHFLRRSAGEGAADDVGARALMPAVVMVAQQVVHQAPCAAALDELADGHHPASAGSSTAISARRRACTSSCRLRSTSARSSPCTTPPRFR
jgi:hypothetical protein